MNTLKHRTNMPSIFSNNLGDMFQGFFAPIKDHGLGGDKHILPAVDIEENE